MTQAQFNGAGRGGRGYSFRAPARVILRYTNNPSCAVLFHRPLLFLPSVTKASCYHLVVARENLHHAHRLILWLWTVVPQALCLVMNALGSASSKMLNGSAPRRCTHCGSATFSTSRYGPPVCNLLEGMTFSTQIYEVFCQLTKEGLSHMDSSSVVFQDPFSLAFVEEGQLALLSISKPMLALRHSSPVFNGLLEMPSTGFVYNSALYSNELACYKRTTIETRFFGKRSHSYLSRPPMCASFCYHSFGPLHRKKQV